MFGWKRKQTSAPQAQIPEALDPQAQSNSAELDLLKARMRRQREGRDTAPAPSLLEIAAGGLSLGEGTVGACNDAADGFGNAAILGHDLYEAEARPSDYDEVGEAYKVEPENGWDIGSYSSRFGAGGVGVAMDAIGVARGVYDLQEAGRNRYKAKTKAGKMLANREIKDASLDTTSSVLGLGGGIASMAAGSVPGLDAGRLLFDAGRSATEGVIAANEARRLHSRDLTRGQRDDDLDQVALGDEDKGRRYRTERFFMGDRADRRAKLRKFKAAREQWRAGELDDADYADTYASLDDSQRADEIRRDLARHKRRRAGDQFYQTAANTVDAAGSFTGGADYGATKLAGKGLKLARGGLGLGRKGVIRAERVHKLRKAKNQVAGEGDVDPGHRSPLWGARQFFLGNVERQRAKLDAEANAGQFDDKLETAGQLDGFRQLTVPRDERDARDLQEMTTRVTGTPHELSVREGARKTGLAAGVMSREGYRELEAAAASVASQSETKGSAAWEAAKEEEINRQLWGARDDRVGQANANVGKLLLDRQFSH